MVYSKKIKGGLRIKQNRLFNQAMWMKLAWKLWKNEGRKWIKVYKNKYLEMINNFLSLQTPLKAPLSGKYW